MTIPVIGISERSVFRGAGFEEDRTDQQVLRATNRKLACDAYSPSPQAVHGWPETMSITK